MLRAIDLRRQRCVFCVQIASDDLHVLEERAVVSHRLESKPHELRSDEISCDMVFAAASVASCKII